MNTELFIVSSAEDGGIFRYQLTEQGRLSVLDHTPLNYPMYLIREDENYYAVLRDSFPDRVGGMQQLVRRPEGTLIPKGEVVSTQGEVPCHLCVWDNQICCANYVTGSWIRLPDELVEHQGNSVHPSRQTAAHVHFVSPTSDGKYLAAVDLGMDQIVTYDKELRLCAASSVAPGTGARHLAFSKDGKLAYCVGELAGTVVVLSYQDGRFTPLQTYSLLPEDFSGDNLAAAIRIYEDVLYVSNRGHDSIARFQICGEQLNPMGWFSCGGQAPRDFEVTEQFLICTNQTSNSVTVLSRITGQVIHTETVEQPLGAVVIDKEENKCCK